MSSKAKKSSGSAAHTARNTGLHEPLWGEDGRFIPALESLPVALWAEEYSELGSYIAELQSRGIHDFAAYFSANPEAQNELFARIKPLAANAALLEMVEARTMEELAGHLQTTVSTDMILQFAGLIPTLLKGMAPREIDTRILTLSGKVRHVRVRWVIPPQRGLKASAVLLSLTDLSDQKEIAESLRHIQVRLTLLNSISTRMTSGLSVMQLIRFAVDQISGYFPDVRITYSTIDTQEIFQVLYSVAPPGYPTLNGYSADLSHADEYRKALLAQQPLAVSDVEQAAYLRPLLPELRRCSIRAILDAPVRHADFPVGVLRFDAPLERRWSAHEISTLSEVAEYLGVAIHEAHELHERLQAEKALRESKEFAESLIASMQDGFIVFDINGSVIEVNQAFCDMTGFARKEILGKQPSASFAAPEHAERIWNCISKPRAANHKDLEVHFVRKNGEEIAVILNPSTLTTERGSASGYLTTVKDITERKRSEAALQTALEEVSHLKNRLQAENVYLREEIKLQHNFHEIISQSAAMEEVLHKVEQVAETDTTVLILGETGTGKELLARALHNTGPRRERPMVKINCAALPPGVIESELFGHEKGAFTGAINRKIGRFELADSGTLFLDEIGDLPLELQAKLLRVLQEGEFERIGSTQSIRVDVRLIAATNRNLQELVNDGKFREDLYYRLNVFPLHVPPLRRRREDIPLLVQHFVRRFTNKMAKNIEIIPHAVMEELSAYAWPGNVRELENIIERAVIISTGNTLMVEEMSELELPRPREAISRVWSDYPPKANARSLPEIERDLILDALQEADWTIEGKKGAAQRLEIAPSTLRDRMRKYGIKKPAR